MNNSEIAQIRARHLIDCKCRGLLEVDVITKSGVLGRASAPTGTSVGSCESFVMRDKPGRFLGTSVYSTVDIVENTIAPAIVGLNVTDQEKIDQTLLELDGTPLKTMLGGNSIYGVSFACALAAANYKNIPFHHYLKQDRIDRIPLPVMNMFNGGEYGDISVQIQEFGIIPYGADDMQEAVEMGIVIFNEIGKMITKYQDGMPPGIANYFGHKPVSNDPDMLFDIIDEAVDRCGYSERIVYTADFAANEFYNRERNTYTYMGEEIDRDEMIGKVHELTSKHRFYSVEDILEDNDFEGFSLAVKKIPDVRIIGDDLVCTNVERLNKAIMMNCCDAIVFKPNQIGTVSQSVNTYRYAQQHEIMVIPSVRAGGTIDDPVKDMAIALNVPLCKCGAPRSGERISFLNTLMRAADEYPEATFYPILEMERATQKGCEQDNEG